jgi:hypothetical protein
MCFYSIAETTCYQNWRANEPQPCAEPSLSSDAYSLIHCYSKYGVWFLSAAAPTSAESSHVQARLSYYIVPTEALPSR